MAGAMARTSSVSLEGVNSGRLFLGSCLALISTAVSFAVIGDIMGPLKSHFALTNQDVGYIGGASLWGFTISMFLLGALVDALGMGRLLAFAFLCHILGPLVMMFAKGFGGLFLGALIISFGNGTVEAVCNPLVATIFPTRKTEKLNHFHVWFPGGIVIGGLLCFLFGILKVEAWQARLVLIMIPTVIYGFLFLGQRIPATERVQSGVSFGEMYRATLLRPLFLILFLCMAITASLELGPGRWIPAILTAGGIAGILVLVWINGLMALLRMFAGPVVHRLSPTGVLLVSAILAGIGLYWLSFAETTPTAFAAATVFALGVCYFWPTMLGVVAERVPRGGSLALALMGGMGMAAVGLFTTPQMGKIADKYLNEKLPVDTTKATLGNIAKTLPGLKSQVSEKQAGDLQKVADTATDALAKSTESQLAQPQTANALRGAKDAPVKDPVTAEAAALINPADNYGGRMSFRHVAPFALILVLVFGALYFRDRAAGGYRAEHISERAEEPRQSAVAEV